MSDTIREAANKAGALVQQIRPLFRGENPEVVGAALGELLALWLAGHQGPGKENLRVHLLADLVKYVEGIVPIIEAELFNLGAPQ